MQPIFLKEAILHRQIKENPFIDEKDDKDDDTTLSNIFE